MSDQDISCSECEIFISKKKYKSNGISRCVDFRWKMEIFDEREGLSFQDYSMRCFHLPGTILVSGEQDEV